MGSIYVICSRHCPNGDGIYTLLYALYKYSTSITNQPTNQVWWCDTTASEPRRYFDCSISRQMTPNDKRGRLPARPTHGVTDHDSSISK